MERCFKIIKTALTCFIISFAVLYFIVSFITWQFNILEWGYTKSIDWDCYYKSTKNSIEFCTIRDYIPLRLTIIFLLIASVCYGFEKNSKKNRKL